MKAGAPAGEALLPLSTQPVPGIIHFRASVDKGIDILRALTGTISGCAVPRFVIDAPDGKVPAGCGCVLSKDDRAAVLETFRGAVYRYPQPHRSRA